MTTTDTETKLEKARRVRTENKKKAEIRVTLEARSERQAEYIKALHTRTQVFGVGVAGSGKTFLAAAHSIQQLFSNKVERIIITRPTITKKRHQIGFLPGNIDDKLEPWLVPVIDAMATQCSKIQLEKWRKDRTISFLSFEHMRGRTFSNSVVILDEAQNCSYTYLQLFLTRIGENTQILVNGDLDQIDIDDSGLLRVIKLIEQYNIDAAVIKFTDDDVVRSEAAKQWVKAFRAAG